MTSQIHRRRGALLVGALLVAACSSATPAGQPSSGTAPKPPAPPRSSPAALTGAADLHQIKHVIVVMQENRSFDSYFGTFPGADGIPMSNGSPSVCSMDALTAQCVKPYHDASDRNGGGPHGATNALADINGGHMDGFQTEAAKGNKGCGSPNDPACANAATTDVMGYHDQREIPNYWSYAQNFVLQDHLFEPNASWSLPQHLFMVSEWSAKCRSSDPSSCINELQSPARPDGARGAATPADYAWTDLTYLMHKNNVPWKYFVEGAPSQTAPTTPPPALPSVSVHGRGV